MSCVTRTTVAGRLQAQLAPLIAEVSARARLMVEHPNPIGMYANLLEFLHSEMRASVPLLSAARDKAVGLAAGGDAVAEALIDWLDRHIAEEAGHENWVLADYSRIGRDPDALVRCHGSPTVGAMVGSVYYWTLHAHPVAILGYCAVLEGTPPTAAFIDRLQQRTGYPAEAFHTLRQHSDVDINHGGELFALLDSLPLTPGHEAIVSLAALQTADLLIAIGDELLDAASDPDGRPARPG
jgi:hypothetical protein